MSFAQITDPLVYLKSPKDPFKWTNAHNEAFTKFQKIFYSKPFVQQPQFHKTFYLDTEASKSAISAILMQGMMAIYFQFLTLIRPCGMLKSSTRLLN